MNIKFLFILHLLIEIYEMHNYLPAFYFEQLNFLLHLIYFTIFYYMVFSFLWNL